MSSNPSISLSSCALYYREREIELADEDQDWERKGKKEKEREELMNRRKRSFQESAGEGQKSNPNREGRKRWVRVSLKMDFTTFMFTCNHKRGKISTLESHENQGRFKCLATPWNIFHFSVSFCASISPYVRLHWVRVRPGGCVCVVLALPASAISAI